MSLEQSANVEAENTRQTRLVNGRYVSIRESERNEKKRKIINAIQTFGIIIALVMCSYAILADNNYNTESIENNDEINYLIQTNSRDSDEICIAGGLDIHVGYDNDQNGNISEEEITSSSIVCHGTMGLSGPQGQAGISGSNGSTTLLVTEEIPYGNATCPLGGHSLLSGLDSNYDGELNDDEIVTINEICNGMMGQNGADGQNGENGTSGYSALVRQEAPDAAICRLGIIIHFGVDNGQGDAISNDGILHDDEVTESLKICSAINEGHRITDIVPNVTNSFTNSCSSLGHFYTTNSVIMAAGNLANGCELWMTDGTVNGESLLLDINPTGDSLPGRDLGFINVQTSFGERVFFDADDGQNGRELWVSDGTSTGTYMISNLKVGDGITSITQVATWNEGLVYSTQNGNQLLFTNGERNHSISVFEASVFNINQIQTLLSETSTWSSFGGVEMYSNGEDLWFNADDPSIGFEPRLLTTDGQLLSFDVNTGGDSFSNSFTETEEGMIIIATQSNGGRQLTLLDEFGNITTLTNLVLNGTSTPITNLGSNLGLEVVNNKIVFDAITTGNQYELWSYFLDTGHTRLLSDQIEFAGTGTISANTGNVLFFDCIYPNSGVELCRTDGTVDGTSIAIDMIAGNLSGEPKQVTNYDEFIFFISESETDDGIIGNSLWVLNSESMVLNQVLNPWEGVANDSNAGMYGNLISTSTGIYFIAENGIHGHELYAWNHSMITDDWVIWP